MQLHIHNANEPVSLMLSNFIHDSLSYKQINKYTAIPTAYSIMLTDSLDSRIDSFVQLSWPLYC